MQCGDILYKFMIVRTILCDKRDDLTNFKGFACTVSSGYRGKEILRLVQQRNFYYRTFNGPLLHFLSTFYSANEVKCAQKSE